MKYSLSGRFFSMQNGKDGFWLAFWALEPYNHFCQKMPMQEIFSISWV